jgi:antitoxin (DNA-binding transcriptional repressor) of toxin-antitoxin stability system
MRQVPDTRWGDQPRREFRMSTITLHEAQSRLVELMHGLSPGEVLTITENDRPVARLVPIPLVRQRPPRPRPPVTVLPKAGQYEGRLIVPDDFKEPLDEMREYME